MADEFYDILPGRGIYIGIKMTDAGGAWIPQVTLYERLDHESDEVQHVRRIDSFYLRNRYSPNEDVEPTLQAIVKKSREICSEKGLSLG